MSCKEEVKQKGGNDLWAQLTLEEWNEFAGNTEFSFTTFHP